MSFFPSLLINTPSIALKVVLLFSTLNSARLLQPAKAFLPILVTLAGMVISVRLVQPKKALPPMLFTLAGMVILVRLVQSAKALSPMAVTVFPSSSEGIVNDHEELSL